MNPLFIYEPLAHDIAYALCFRCSSLTADSPSIQTLAQLSFQGLALHGARTRVSGSLLETHNRSGRHCSAVWQQESESGHFVLLPKRVPVEP